MKQIGDITYDGTYEEGTRFVVKIPINPSEGN